MPSTIGSAPHAPWTGGVPPPVSAVVQRAASVPVQYHPGAGAALQHGVPTRAVSTIGTSVSQNLTGATSRTHVPDPDGVIRLKVAVADYVPLSSSREALRVPEPEADPPCPARARCSSLTLSPVLFVHSSQSYVCT